MNSRALGNLIGGKEYRVARMREQRARQLAIGARELVAIPVQKFLQNHLGPCMCRATSAKRPKSVCNDCSGMMKFMQ
ncbi:MAG TPA: hypothetical protein VFM11_10245 [Burkholderiales bacterium]|nr:hypothetical protein [Burkholderiales bacterium]